VGVTPIVIPAKAGTQAQLRRTTSFLAVISKDVDGGPSPAMTGKAKPESQQ
jgi:hypothetical protein